MRVSWMRVSWMRFTGDLSLEKGRLKGLLETFTACRVARRVTRLATPLAVAGALFAAGCAAPGALRIPRLTDVDVPVWVVKGSGAFGGDFGGLFHGVSSAQGISNPDILRATADRRARVELRELVNAYAAMMAEQYYSEKGRADRSASIPDKKTLAKTLSVITRKATKTSVILERWQNPRNREQYSLATLEVSAFVAALERVPARDKGLKALDKGLKAFMRKNAVRLLREFKGGGGAQGKSRAGR